MANKIDEEKVKADVLKAFKVLAETGGIKIGAGDLPHVRVEYGEEAASCYQPANHEVIIAEDRVNDGAVYFEETSHALRDVIKRRQGIPEKDSDRRIEEFYGMAGEMIGKKLAKEKGLGHLEWKEELNPRERWVQTIKVVKDIRGIMKESKAEGLPEDEEAHREASRLKYSVIAHRRPYDYALQNSADDFLNEKGFYSLPYKEVKDKYFHKKPAPKGGLEKAVNAVFYALSALFAIYILLGLKITGFSILGSGAGFALTSLLGILFFFFLTAFLYFKIRSRQSKQRTLF